MTGDMMACRNNYKVKNGLGLEIHFLWEIKKDGEVKNAPMFCCLGDIANTEKLQGVKDDDDASI